MQPHLYINLGVCWPVGESLQTLAHFIVCEDVEGGKGHLDQHRYCMEWTQHLRIIYYVTGVNNWTFFIITVVGRNWNFGKNIHPRIGWECLNLVTLVSSSIVISCLEKPHFGSDGLPWKMHVGIYLDKVDRNLPSWKPSQELDEWGFSDERQGTPW